MGAEATLTISELVQRCASSATARFAAHEAGLRTGDDPESVHQTRVATRRLRSDLKTFRDFVDHEWATTLRGELRWLAGELGAVRDLEVLRDRLRTHAAQLAPADTDAADRAIRRVDADRVAARAELHASLDSPRFAELRRALDDAAAAPRVVDHAGTPAHELVGPVVKHRWKQLRRAVDDLGTWPSDEALHAVRIRAKRARYAAEAVTPAFGKPAKRFAAAVEAVQELLGEQHDAVIALAWLAKTAPECSAGEAYALGMLAEIEREASVSARAQFPDVWARARRKRLRQWM